jgi:hypothetical protein
MWVYSTFGGDLPANPELRRFARSAAAVVLFPASEAIEFAVGDFTFAAGHRRIAIKALSACGKGLRCRILTASNRPRIARPRRGSAGQSRDLSRSRSPAHDARDRCDLRGSCAAARKGGGRFAGTTYFDFVFAAGHDLPTLRLIAVPRRTEGAGGFFLISIWCSFRRSPSSRNLPIMFAAGLS